MLVTQDDLDKLAAEQDSGMPYLVVARGAVFPRPIGQANRIHAIRGFGRVAGLATWRVARWAAVLAAGAVVVWMAFAVPDLGLWTR
jgi:hypothetical protein